MVIRRTKNLKKDVVLDKLKKILEDSSIKKVCQNTKYDFIIFKNSGKIPEFVARISFPNI